MCLNDLCDVKEDRIKKSFRPLPSQRISIKQATLFTIALFGLALFLLLLVSYQRAFGVGLILLLLIIVYDRIHKGHPSSVFLMAACRLLVFVISAMAISGGVSAAVWVGGFVQFIYVLLLSLVARHENHLKTGFSFPVIPMMLACISLLDGVVMASFISPIWLLPGLGGAVLTHFAQKYIKGD
jgi:4-hydroxybenzoate polyprenyltransferase